MSAGVPKNKQELDQIFNTVRIPEPAEFNGEYFVDMLTGLPSLRMFKHRKVFYSQNGKVIGNNILFNGFVWGSFYLEEGFCENYDRVKAVIISYRVPKNSFITNKMIDYVRCIEKDRLYLGRFNYLFMGKIKFLGYFSLKKKENAR
jgi:hypothetical protein